MPVINKFDKKVRSYIKTQARVKSATDDYALMEGDALRKRIPPGTPACSIGLTDPEMDLPWAASTAQEHTIEIKIPKGTVRRRVVELMHREYTLWRKQVELEVVKERLASVKAEASKETFVNTCKDICKEEFEKDIGTSLGCDPVKTESPPEDALLKIFTSYYEDIVTKVNKDEDSKKAEIEKKEGKAKKNKEDMMLEQPEVLFDGVIEARVGAKLAEALKAQSSDDMADVSAGEEDNEGNCKDPRDKELAHLKQLVAQFQKNGGRPAGRQADHHGNLSKKQRKAAKKMAATAPKGGKGSAKASTWTEKGKKGSKGYKSGWSTKAHKGAKAGDKGAGKGAKCGDKGKGFSK